MGKDYKKTLRIFVASPGDVKEERERLHAVAAELNRSGNVADQLGVTLEVLDWRDVSPKMGRPEKVILDELPVERWDFFVGVLWLRFGLPPGASDPQTGKPYDSGTEEEFALAYRSWLKNGRPQIFFYRCKRQPDDLDGIDLDQYKKVKLFFTNFDNDKQHPGLYKTFQTDEDFVQHVRDDLIKSLFEFYRDSNTNLCPLCNGTRTHFSSYYLTLQKNKPVIIEKVPAKVCQKCGDRYFESDTIKRIQQIAWSKTKPIRTLQASVYRFPQRNKK
jgi:YgiT-type zinc finger domain-containing protein